MVTLMSDQFAPITSAIGFLRLPLARAADALEAWRRDLHGSVEARNVTGSLGELLSELEPLTSGVRPRNLLLATASQEWTAYFDCGLRGGDPVSTIGHLTYALQCHGIAIRAVPHTIGTQLERPGRYGSVQFELFGPLMTDFINYVRTISVAHDGTRWRFDAAGTVQDFERPEAYRARTVRDRFTSEMLAEYCLALGVRPFDVDFYGDGILIESAVEIPPEGEALSLEQAQQAQGIRPGSAERLPG
jgi:hypothetical protein